MVSDRAFIFHICIPWGKALSLVPHSRLSVKVKVRYQGYSFRKNGYCRDPSLSQTQLVNFNFFISSSYFDWHLYIFKGSQQNVKADLQIV